ncbi:hypothetical protein MBRA_06393 [Methylobacterium brachiatum]|nr:hypothetical protein MBRA_06393 [Methylobacterium brachiatum]
MAEGLAEPPLTIEINNRQPVELADLTSALAAVNSQYQRYLMESDEAVTKEEAKLFVHTIRPGSIVAELVSYAAAHPKELVDVAKAGGSMIGFAKQLTTSLAELRDGKKVPSEMLQKDLKDLSRLMDIPAKDPGSTLQIYADRGSTVNVSLTIGSTEANAIQNRITKEIEARKEPEQTVYNRVLMYWHTASRGTARKKSGKAVIDKISDQPLTVLIDDPDMRTKMLAGKDNPLLIGFLVDVEVMYVSETPRVYRVLKLYEAVEEPAEDEQDD